MSAVAGADAGAAAGADAVAAVADDLYGELADTRQTNEIQDYLFTKIISPRRLLSECMKVHSVSIPTNKVPDPDGPILGVVVFSSFGNHGTHVCPCNHVNIPESRITALLNGKALDRNTGVNTIIFNQAVGVAQPVFPQSIDRIKELFVLGKIDYLRDAANAPLDLNDLIGKWEEFAHSIIHDLNEYGIKAGREAFKIRLTSLFERLRDLEDSPKVRESRIKYCRMLLDLWRKDLIHGFGSTIQKGVLASINTGRFSGSDHYDVHHGKPVLPNTAISKAAYNILFLVNVVIGGEVWTIHIEINRKAVEALLKQENDQRKHRDSTSEDYQRVSYWVGDVVEWIHRNKHGFFSIVHRALISSVPAFNFPDHIGVTHKKYLIQKMRDMIALPHEFLPVLNHAPVILSCKCFTLYDPTQQLLFRRVDDSSSFNRSSIVTTPTTDMTVGTILPNPKNTGPINFVSIEPILVTTLPSGDVRRISDIIFDYDPIYFHTPTYDDTFIGNVLGLKEGESFESMGFTYTGSDSSLQLKDSFEREVDAQEDKEAAVKKAKADEEAQAKADEEALAKEEAKKLIKEIKVDIVESKKNSTDLVESIARSTKPNIIIQAFNYICDSLLSPFKALKRTRSGTEHVDEDTAMSISIILACALNLFECYETRNKYESELKNHIKDAEQNSHELHEHVNSMDAADAAAPTAVISKKRQVYDHDIGREDESHVEWKQVLESKLREARSLIKTIQGNIKLNESMISHKISLMHEHVKQLFLDQHSKADVSFGDNPKYNMMTYCRENHMPVAVYGGKRRRTLRRGVKKNTRRERRASIRSRCRSGRWQYRSSSSSGKLKKNTQRCRSRNSKTRRKRKATRT
jgi:hypothetical protein